MSSTVVSVVETKKFHNIFGKELAIALESTLDTLSGKELEFDPELYGGNEELLYRKNDCWRAYFPASVVGDLTTDQEITINFLPWFSGPQVLYYRLVFRAKSIASKIFCWVMFARFGEEKPFTFSKDKPFINLDFYSKRNNHFMPLFVKIRQDGGEFTYFVIEGLWNEEAVMLKIRIVTESEAPPHLAAAKP